MAILTNLSIGAFVFIAGASSTYIAQQTDGLVDGILGPTGALAFAVVSLGLLVKYLLRQQKRLDESVDGRLQDKDNIIKNKDDEIKHLRSLIEK